MRFFSVFQKEIVDFIPSDAEGVLPFFVNEELVPVDESALSDTHRKERLARLMADMDIVTVSDIVDKVKVTELAPADVIAVQRDEWAQMVYGIRQDTNLKDRAQALMKKRRVKLFDILSKIPEDAYMPVKSGMKIRLDEQTTRRLVMPKAVRPYFISYYAGTYLVGDEKAKQYALTQDTRVAVMLLYLGYSVDKTAALAQGISWGRSEPYFVDKKLQKRWETVKVCAAEEDTACLIAGKEMGDKIGLNAMEIFTELQNTFMEEQGRVPRKIRSNIDRFPVKTIEQYEEAAEAQQQEIAKRGRGIKGVFAALVALHAVVIGGTLAYENANADTTNATPKVIQKGDVLRDKPVQTNGKRNVHQRDL